MFVKGDSYERTELLNFIGSKQPQSGIIWNKEGSDTIIITTGGRHTKRVGYSDHLQADGSWIYTGQGEKGDQNPQSFANSLLTKKEKKVLLFSTHEPNASEVRSRGNHKKLYQFEGLFKVQSWKLETQKEGKRKGDKLVKCILQPIEDFNYQNVIIKDPLENVIIEPSEFYNLRSKIIKAVKKKLSKLNKNSTAEYYNRSEDVKKYALLRANGQCENCGKDAPFVNSNNIPFLEVHHIFSLADDGPDHPINVAAICPNCHRQSHFGKDMQTLKVKLAQKIIEKEDGY